MSSVIKKNQSPHRFTTLDLILDCYEHTTNVIANPKFDQCRMLKERIDYEASMIYHCCRTANEDYDNRKEDEAKIRIKLQKDAIEHCLWLKTDIRLAQRKLHLRASKVTFWNSKVNIALESIKAWNISEVRSFKEKHGL